MFAKSQITYCFNLKLDFALFATDLVCKMSLVVSNLGFSIRLTGNEMSINTMLHISLLQPYARFCGLFL